MLYEIENLEGVPANVADAPETLHVAEEDQDYDEDEDYEYDCDDEECEGEAEVDIEALRAAMENADSLIDLLAAWQAICESGLEPESIGVDLTDLPTFGGLRVSDPEYVWSWDCENILFGRYSGELEIISRADFFERRTNGELL